MHKIQEKILQLSRKKDLNELSYREIGKLVGVEYAQQVKHHIQQLIKKGFLDADRDLHYLELLKVAKNLQPKIINVPLVGAANCGPATLLTEDKIEGYLKISSTLLPKTESIFALKAEGNSMNKSNIKGNNIEDGDYVIVDYKYKNPKDGDYVISVIEDCANIKKYKYDKAHKQIELISESTEDYLPIIISSDEYFMINGKVISVIKVN
ncbi:MAG: S24 family peptidase [Patescibacteria group bacterium]|nr:S24 family peptidase [Patescibacteria group bacterium]